MPVESGTVDCMGKQHGLAAVRQKERLVATLRPVPNGTVVAASPTVLSEMRPLTLTPRSDWEHGFARLDECGRVRDAIVMASLGWSSGDEVSFELGDERVVIKRGEGLHRIDARGRLALPETIRKALGLGAGDGVLLSASSNDDLLVVVPARLCDLVVNQ